MFYRSLTETEVQQYQTKMVQIIEMYISLSERVYNICKTHHDLYIQHSKTRFLARFRKVYDFETFCNALDMPFQFQEANELFSAQIARRGYGNNSVHIRLGYANDEQEFIKEFFAVCHKVGCYRRAKELVDQMVMFGGQFPVLNHKEEVDDLYFISKEHKTLTALCDKFLEKK